MSAIQERKKYPRAATKPPPKRIPNPIPTKVDEKLAAFHAIIAPIKEPSKIRISQMIAQIFNPFAFES